MAKLDDFLTKKKEVAPILDLSKTYATTKEEFKRIYDRVPDLKIRPEKVKIEDVKIKEKKFKFKTGKKDLKIAKETYSFMDPLPHEMRELSIDDLASVAIDWKMLTTNRPKNKTEEEMFSRLVELRKLQVKTAASDKRSIAMESQIRKIKNKSGVVECRVVACHECGEDFCNGKVCGLFSYDSFARVADLPPKVSEKAAPSETAKNKEKKKIKKTKRVKKLPDIKPKTKEKSKKKTNRSRSRSKSPKKEKPKTKK